MTAGSLEVNGKGGLVLLGQMVYEVDLIHNCHYVRDPMRKLDDSCPDRKLHLNPSIPAADKPTA